MLPPPEPEKSGLDSNNNLHLLKVPPPHTPLHKSSSTSKLQSNGNGHGHHSNHNGHIPHHSAPPSPTIPQRPRSALSCNFCPGATSNHGLTADEQRALNCVPSRPFDLKDFAKAVQRRKKNKDELKSEFIVSPLYSLFNSGGGILIRFDSGCPFKSESDHGCPLVLLNLPDRISVICIKSIN